MVKRKKYKNRRAPEIGHLRKTISQLEAEADAERDNVVKKDIERCLKEIDVSKCSQVV